MKYNKILLAGLFTLGGLPAAHAGLISSELPVPSLSAAISVNGTSSTLSLNTAGQTVDLGGGTGQFMGATSNNNFNFGWTLTANADPFIAGNITFTNNTSVDQTFNIVLTLPTALISGPVQETGELGLTIKDADRDGTANLTLSQWHGLINPLTPPPILDMPLLLGTSYFCATPGCTTTQTPVSRTQLHSEVDHNGNAISSIGTHINFSLSAGDSVSIDTRWNVSPVPVPAAVWLFGSGLLGLLATARRQRK